MDYCVFFLGSVRALVADLGYAFSSASFDAESSNGINIALRIELSRLCLYCVNIIVIIMNENNLVGYPKNRVVGRLFVKYAQLSLSAKY